MPIMVATDRNVVLIDANGFVLASSNQTLQPLASLVKTPVSADLSAGLSGSTRSEREGSPSVNAAPSAAR